MAFLYAGSSSTAIESVEDLLIKKAAHDCPVLSLFISPKPSGTSKDPTVKDVTHKWTDKTLNSTRGTLAADITNSGTSITVDNKYMNFIATGASGYYSYILIDDEVIKVASASLSGNTWTLTCTAGRGAFSSSAAAHSAGAQVSLMNVHDEGMDASVFEQDLGEKVTNYTQIFRSDVKLSGTAQAIQTYGNELDINVQIEEKIPNLFQQLENALVLNNVCYSSSQTRAMGGMNYFIQSAMKKDSSGNPFSLKTLANDVDELLGYGVDPNNLLMLAGANVIQSIQNKKAEIVQETMQLRELNYKIDSLVVPGVPRINVIDYARVVPKNSYYLFDRRSVKVKFLRPLEVEDLAKTGDNDKKMVIMEATSEFHTWKQNGALRRINVA